MCVCVSVVDHIYIYIYIYLYTYIHIFIYILEQVFYGLFSTCAEQRVKLLCVHGLHSAGVRICMCVCVCVCVCGIRLFDRPLLLVSFLCLFSTYAVQGGGAVHPPHAQCADLSYRSPSYVSFIRLLYRSLLYVSFIRLFYTSLL